MENKEIVLDVLIENLSKDIDKITKNDIIILLKEVKKNKQELNNLALLWEKFVLEQGEKRLSNFYQKSGVQSQEILNILKTADVFLDKIRELFTGQKLPYLVGFIYKGKLHQYSLTLSQVYSLVRLDRESGKIGSLKARLTLGRKKIMEIAKDWKEVDNDISEKDIEKIYLRLSRFKTDIKKPQYGNIYEMLSLMHDLNLNHENLTALQLKKIRDRVTKNITKGLAGPDTTAQVKFYKASLSNVSLLLNYYNDVEKIFTLILSGNKNQASTELKKLFTKDADDLNREALEKAKERIELIINKI